MITQPLTSCAAFIELQQHCRQMHLQGTTIAELFAREPERFEQFSLSAANLFLDYSKNQLTGHTVDLLCKLAQARQVEAQRTAMFAGEKINVTEHRAVLHGALREPAGQPRWLEGVDINAQIHAVLERMQALVADVHAGTWRGTTGAIITDVVNIGIGGSDLGPKMVTQALRSFAHPGLRSHFVSNVDGHALEAVLAGLDPASTLFVISSKTFTTAETMLNAHSARNWLVSQLTHAEPARHFVAVTTNLSAAAEFGINANNCFEFWDWVGGRYSLWSAIGLPIALALGFAHFRALLDGAHAMDRHFQEAPLAQNMPVLLALTGLWNRNLLGYDSLSIAPYHQDLESFPNYLQQLDMESNGKSVDREGRSMGLATGPVIWGNVGTNAQHAYFQLLHQGSDIIPVDFIAALKPQHSLARHQTLLLANCFAQSQALMQGKPGSEVAAEMRTQAVPAEDIDRLVAARSFAGNRPSNTILLQQLDPASLGALIALYEHKVAVQGFCWGINSFDQWGVELGKVLARTIEADLTATHSSGDHDSSTAGLISLARGAASK